MDLTTNLNNPAERRKQVRLKVRPDLQTYEQKYEGKGFHVVKDPVCLRYYRFNRQEYFVFSLFDGHRRIGGFHRAWVGGAEDDAAASQIALGAVLVPEYRQHVAGALRLDLLLGDHEGFHGGMKIKESKLEINGGQT